MRNEFKTSLIHSLATAWSSARSNSFQKTLKEKQMVSAADIQHSMDIYSIFHTTSYEYTTPSYEAVVQETHSTRHNMFILINIIKLIIYLNQKRQRYEILLLSYKETLKNLHVLKMKAHRKREQRKLALKVVQDYYYHYLLLLGFTCGSIYDAKLDETNYKFIFTCINPYDPKEQYSLLYCPKALNCLTCIPNIIDIEECSNAFVNKKINLRQVLCFVRHAFKKAILDK